MLTIPTLETDRLRLRPYRRDDFAPYAAMWADPGVLRHTVGTPLSREQMWTRFLRQIGLWYHLGFGFFVLEEKASGAFVGEAGFHDLHREITPSLKDTLETGWVLAPGAQGKGYATEAVRAALAWAADRYPALRTTCIIEPENRASLRVAVKLGFQEFARTTYHDRSFLLLER